MFRTLLLSSLLLIAASAHAVAPDTFKVKFETTAGDFVVEFHRDWAPRGADRVYDLVQAKYYDDCRFFRVMRGFMAQFGLNGNPALTRRWADTPIKDDPAVKSNSRGRVTFAAAGPNSRSTQLFISTGDNSRLDRMGFAPVGQVISGMDFVDKISDKYGEEPDQNKIRTGGNDYLQGKYPRLDYIKTARIIE